MRILRNATEDEVITAFLRAEYYHSDFDDTRDLLSHYVFSSEDSEVSQSVRRELFFRRRQNLWSALPADTRWVMGELETRDLERTFLLSRGHWNTLASGDRRLQIVSQVFRTKEAPDIAQHHRQKIEHVRQALVASKDVSSVVLIGASPESCLVVLEGNHRLTAAMLVSSDFARQRFQVFCGFSSRMKQCIWFQDSPGNRLRHAYRLLRMRLLGGYGRPSARLSARDLGTVDLGTTRL